MTSSFCVLSSSVKQADNKLKNTSQDNQSIAKVIPENSVDVDSQEGPISSGNLTNDSADDPSHEPVLSNGLTTVGKESQSLSNENLNATRITGETPSCRSSVVSLDLSVPLPGEDLYTMFEVDWSRFDSLLFSAIVIF